LPCCCLFLCASPCCCLLPPSHFTLQLLAPSFALHFVAACSLPCTSLCNCLSPPSCLVLLLHIPYLAFHLTTTCFFPHALPYFLPTPLHFILCSTLELKYYYHSLSNDVLLPTPSHFTLMFALCQLIFPPSFIFTSERTWIKLGVWSLFNLVSVFFWGNFWVFYWIETRCFMFFSFSILEKEKIPPFSFFPTFVLFYCHSFSFMLCFILFFHFYFVVLIFFHSSFLLCSSLMFFFVCVCRILIS
jgi:hypothetical protein